MTARGAELRDDYGTASDVLRVGRQVTASGEMSFAGAERVTRVVTVAQPAFCKTKPIGVASGVGGPEPGRRCLPNEPIAPVEPDKTKPIRIGAGLPNEPNARHGARLDCRRRNYGTACWRSRGGLRASFAQTRPYLIDARVNRVAEMAR